MRRIVHTKPQSREIEKKEIIENKKVFLET